MSRYESKILQAGKRCASSKSFFVAVPGDALVGDGSVLARFAPPHAASEEGHVEVAKESIAAAASGLNGRGLRMALLLLLLQQWGAAQLGASLRLVRRAGALDTSQWR